MPAQLFPQSNVEGDRVPPYGEAARVPANGENVRVLLNGENIRLPGDEENAGDLVHENFRDHMNGIIGARMPHNEDIRVPHNGDPGEDFRVPPAYEEHEQNREVEEMVMERGIIEIAEEENRDEIDEEDELEINALDIGLNADLSCCRTTVQRELADSIVRLAEIEELSILLKLGAKINGRVTQGLTPLHYAVWQRHAKAAIFLIEQGCDINATDDIGYSPLHLASEHGYIQLLELLLEHGAQVNFNNPSPDDLYPMDVVDEPLRLAIKNDHYDAAKILLQHGANPNGRYFFGHEINLISPFNTEMMELLLSFGADPNSRDRQSMTSLMKACRLHQGSCEELQRKSIVSTTEILANFAEMLEGMKSILLLISNGADVNMRTDERHDNRTVLHYAVLSGSVPMVNLLIKQGANVNFEREYQRPTPLDLAILKGDVPMIELLIGSGVNVNASSPVIGSPLHVAASDNIKNRFEVLKLLLEAGADSNQIIYNEDEKPLRTVLGEYLSSNEEPEEKIVNLFLRFGAEVIMQSQNQEAKGILNDIPNLMKYPNVLLCLLEAAYNFDLPLIRKSSRINEEQRKTFLKVGDCPLSLKHISRVFLRKNLKFKMPEDVKDLFIPKILMKYLLYEIS